MQLYFKNFIFISTSQDLSPLAYPCLLTKLNNQFVTTSSGDVWSPGLGSYFLKIHGFRAKFKGHAALLGSLSQYYRLNTMYRCTLVIF